MSNRTKNERETTKRLKDQIAKDKATLPGWRRAGTLGPDGKVPVSLRAIVQRINRKLAANDEIMKKTRGERWRGELGDWYIVDFRTNTIVGPHVVPAEEARERGVLKPYEEIVDDD
jgi:hypothetical protein